MASEVNIYVSGLGLWFPSECDCNLDWRS